MFQAQAWLLKRFGVDRLLDVVLLTYVLRMLCYASLPAWGTPWAVLPVEVLHGASSVVGAGWFAGVEGAGRGRMGLAQEREGLGRPRPRL